MACPQARSTLTARHCLGLESNACSYRNRSSGDARFPNADGPIMPKGCVGHTTSSSCMGGRYKRSVPDHRFERTAISPAVTNEPSTEASARPMPSNARRASRYGLSGPSTAPRDPADSTAAQNPAYPEATAQATLPSTTADGHWLHSGSPRLDVTFPAATSVTSPLGTARDTGDSYGRSARSPHFVRRAAGLSTGVTSLSSNLPILMPTRQATLPNTPRSWRQNSADRWNALRRCTIEIGQILTRPEERVEGTKRANQKYHQPLFWRSWRATTTLKI
jgi:hypothetical protein